MPVKFAAIANTTSECIVERVIERMMYASRWVLAPIYIGLVLALMALGIKFFQEVFHLLPRLFAEKPIGEGDLILVVLALVDMALVGGLLVMVMFSGYENFVSKLDVQGAEKLDWMGKLDANTLKQKVAASIVAISSIHLLQKFIGVDKLYGSNCAEKPEKMSECLRMAENANEMLMWYVIIHMTFVLSAFMMGMLDKKTKSAT